VAVTPPVSRLAPVRPVRAHLVPERPNNTSVYAAPTLGQWNRGIGLYLGYPVLEARFALGLLDRLNGGVSFDTMYGAMNEVRLHFKWQLSASDHWVASVATEGGPAFFKDSAQNEFHGPRYLTGHRDWNWDAGMVLTYRAGGARSPRLFLDGRCALAFDTEPFSVSPLGGVPPPVAVAGNAVIRAGAEMPFTAGTSFLFSLGFDVHGFAQDSQVMVAAAVGVVFGV